MIDFDKAHKLLDIITKSNPNSYPWLKFIHDAAMAELKGMEEIEKPSRPGQLSDLSGKPLDKPAVVTAEPSVERKV